LCLKCKREKDVSINLEFTEQITSSGDMLAVSFRKVDKQMGKGIWADKEIVARRNRLNFEPSTLLPHIDFDQDVESILNNFCVNHPGQSGGGIEADELRLTG